MTSIPKLRKQKAYAWAKYYEELEKTHNAQTVHYAQMENILGEYELPTHLVNEFQEMMKDLQKNIECPICLDVIQEGELKITGCGHKYCQTCFTKIDKCAVCRKKIRKV